MVRESEHEPQPEQVDRFAGLRRAERDIRAERLEHLGAARGRGHRAPHVLGDLRSRRRRDEGGAGGDVEGMRCVAAGAAGIDQVPVVLHLHRGGELTHHLGGGRDLADGLLLHPQSHDESGDLRGAQLAAHDLAHDVQHLVVEHLAVLDGALDRFGDRDLLHKLPLSAFTRLNLQEILQHFVAVLGQHRLGMELHPFDRQAAVAQAHDLAVLRLRGHEETGRQRRALDYQRVVTRGDKVIGNFYEYSVFIMMYSRGLAMHYLLRAHHFAADRLADRLVAKAHPQERRLSGKPFDQRQADTRFVGRAWPWRDDDARGFEFLNLIQGYFVIPKNL